MKPEPEIQTRGYPKYRKSIDFRCIMVCNTFPDAQFFRQITTNRYTSAKNALAAVFSAPYMAKEEFSFFISRKFYPLMNNIRILYLTKRLGKYKILSLVRVQKLLSLEAKVIKIPSLAAYGRSGRYF